MGNAAQHVPRCTSAEYLAWENDGTLKHEFANGLVYAMSGASRRHNLIAGDLFTAINVHLPPVPCQAFTLDTKVHVLTDTEEHYFYPDVFVTCSDLDADAYASRHPLLIVEATSPSTHDFDWGEKFRAYRLLSSLLEYGLVSQTERRLDLFRRRANWAQEVFIGNATVTLESIGLTVPLDTIYRRAGL